MLHDSSIVEGFVYDVHLKKHVSQGTGYIQGTKIGAMIDTSGYFEIKIPAGKYVIFASSVGCTDIQTDKITLRKNEKRSIAFYLGAHVMYEK